MTSLQRNALARVPLSEDAVQMLYETPFQGLALDAYRTLRAVLESHERLRAELSGACEIIADLECRLDDLLKILRAVVVTCPWGLDAGGSPAFWHAMRAAQDLIRRIDDIMSSMSENKDRLAQIMSSLARDIKSGCILLGGLPDDHELTTPLTDALSEVRRYALKLADLAEAVINRKMTR